MTRPMTPRVPLNGLTTSRGRTDRRCRMTLGCVRTSLRGAWRALTGAPTAEERWLFAGGFEILHGPSHPACREPRCRARSLSASIPPLAPPHRSARRVSRAEATTAPSVGRGSTYPSIEGFRPGARKFRSFRGSPQEETDNGRPPVRGGDGAAPPAPSHYVSKYSFDEPRP